MRKAMMVVCVMLSACAPAKQMTYAIDPREFYPDPETVQNIPTEIIIDVYEVGTMEPEYGAKTDAPE